ncbi:hypothetical protein HK101_007983, partial [Irineochytrium annulatum]
TVDGMLGGFGSLTENDAKSSAAFIKPFVVGGSGSRPPIGTEWACDMGAGIGRVSKSFLLKSFQRVDLVEQNPLFLKEAEENQFADAEWKDRVNFYPVGLQDFTPEEGKYDMIWCQWVLGHLTDDDFVAFFRRCKKGLKPNGVIGIKENVSKAEVEVDTEDSSVTRPEGLLKELLGRAGLRILKEDYQKGFPKGLFKVVMLILD